MEHVRSLFAFRDDSGELVEALRARFSGCLDGGDFFDRRRARSLVDATIPALARLNAKYGLNFDVEEVVEAAALWRLKELRRVDELTVRERAALDRHLDSLSSSGHPEEANRRAVKLLEAELLAMRGPCGAPADRI